MNSISQKYSIQFSLFCVKISKIYQEYYEKLDQKKKIRCFIQASAFTWHMQIALHLHLHLCYYFTFLCVHRKKEEWKRSTSVSCLLN